VWVCMVCVGCVCVCVYGVVMWCVCGGCVYVCVRGVCGGVGCVGFGCVCVGGVGVCGCGCVCLCVWCVLSLICIYVAVCRSSAVQYLIIICFSQLFSNYSTRF